MCRALTGGRATQTTGPEPGMERPRLFPPLQEMRPQSPNNPASRFSDLNRHQTPSAEESDQQEHAPMGIRDLPRAQALLAPLGLGRPYRSPSPEAWLKATVLPFLFCCMMVGGGEDTFMASP